MKTSPAIYARFFLPAIPWAGEKAEWRTVNLNSAKDVEWVKDMTENYASLAEYGLTSFFPNHP